ncbi:MAG: hypothetical protein R2748_23960 [Bryobacterales bacterium]
MTTADLENAAGNNSAWLSYGRDYHAHRYVELDEITPENVQRLRPVWALPQAVRTVAWRPRRCCTTACCISPPTAHGVAINARTGARSGPMTPLRRTKRSAFTAADRSTAASPCSATSSAGTLDSRLVALNKDTGEVAWDVEVVDWRQGYTITGAPLAVKDMVLTGMAGGEFGTRGFVKAFDAKTGELRWTAYTIPALANPATRLGPATHGRTAAARPGPPESMTLSSRNRLLANRQRRAVELRGPQGR